MDLNIQQHLDASSHEYSIELLAGFIMSTHLGLLFLHLFRLFLIEFMFLDHLVPSQSSVNTHVQRKRDHWFKQLFLHRSQAVSVPNLKKNNK